MAQLIAQAIQAMLGFSRTAVTDIVARANAVHTGMSAAKDIYPNPPYDLATFRTQIDLLSEKTAAALDGGKKAIAERNHQAKVVIRMLRQLGHYVEANCNDNLQTFLKSGFEAAPGTRTPAQPLSQFIRRIDPGQISGQFIVMLASVPGAASYELRRGAVGAGGAVAEWTTQALAKIRPPVSLTGLTPGTTYAFQVRALTKSGYTDWSESVTRICV